MTITLENPLASSNASHSGSANLPEWGLIFVEGPDAATLLQNQLSNSVLGLSRIKSGEIAQGHDAVRLVGYCNPKGRLLASAWLALFPKEESSDDRFALFISKDIAAATAKRLSMYVLRSKVKVTHVSSEWQISGIFNLSDELNRLSIKSDSLALRMPDVLVNGQSFGRVLIAQKKEILGQETPNIYLEQWNSLEVLSAIPRIVLATQEQFVPQMINFESVFGVDFKKGCYPGQEIVARSQYRGAVKRRLQLVHLSEDQALLENCKPGIEIFQSGDPAQPAGMVVLAAPNLFDSNRVDLQVECKLDALEGGKIHLANSEGPVLKIDLLPYPLLEI
jgi:folate-binding protein YgfZ